MTAAFLLTVGAILLLGLATDAIGRHTFLPRVTLLLLFGILIGEQTFDLVPDVFTDNFSVIADITLLMVGFLLGEKITCSFKNKTAGTVFWLSITTVLVTALFVVLLLRLFGVDTELAILLGCIAAATAPAATTDVVLESADKSPFADLLLSIVALDDAWALIIFSLGLAVVGSLAGMNSHGFADTFIHITRDIGGAVATGILIGLPAAYLTGRIRQGQPMMMEALGLVFICGGLAMWLQVSFLISAMVMGGCVSAFARHHEYPFHAIQNIEWPFMSLFFVLAGARLDIAALQALGILGAVYIASRILGKITGAWLGATLAHADIGTRRWMGLAMLPQAGVSIGMALIAATQFPQYEQTLLTIVISSTVFFEIIGPVFTRLALSASRSQLDIID